MILSLITVLIVPSAQPLCPGSHMFSSSYTENVRRSRRNVRFQGITPRAHFHQSHLATGLQGFAIAGLAALKTSSQAGCSLPTSTLAAQSPLIAQGLKMQGSRPVSLLSALGSRVPHRIATSGSPLSRLGRNTCLKCLVRILHASGPQRVVVGPETWGLLEAIGFLAAVRMRADR